MKYLMCLMYLILLKDARTNNVFPQKCYFKDAKDPNYLHIDCPNSNITSLPTNPREFIGDIQLSHNQIQVVPNLFIFPTVNKLNLSHNLISKFPWESLKHMKFLSQLDLSYNQLSAVRLGVYMVSSYGLRTITSVTVAYNNLATFSEADLGIIPNNEQIISRHLQGNPFHCDCRMSWLSKLVATYYQKCRSYLSWFSCPLRRGPFYDTLRASDDFKCTTPASLKDTPLRTVNLPACQATTPSNVFLPFTTETTTTAKVTTLSTTTNKFTTTTAQITPLSATTKNKFTTTSVPNATEPSTTMPMIRQVDFFVNATVPKLTISSVNASEKDQHITRPTAATNKVHAPKESAAIPTAALVAIAVVAVLLLALAIAVVTRKIIQKRENRNDGQDGKEQEVELSETKAGSNANP